jgi:hypothetical protein
MAGHPHIRPSTYSAIRIRMAADPPTGIDLPICLSAYLLVSSASAYRYHPHPSAIRIRIHPTIGHQHPHPSAWPSAGIGHPHR